MRTYVMQFCSDPPTDSEIGERKCLVDSANCGACALTCRHGSYHWRLRPCCRCWGQKLDAPPDPRLKPHINMFCS